MGFANNRPDAAAQRAAQRMVDQSQRATQLARMQSTIQRQPAGNGGVIQLSLEDLIKAVQANDKAAFKAKFRGMDAAKDEMISCQVTFDEARRLLAAGDNDGLREFLNTSHDSRFPTAYMGHHVADPGTGEVSRMVHPTSKDTLPYGAPMSAKGNPSWVGHGSFDIGRAAHVGAGVGADDMRDRAIEYSMGAGAMPPYASNGVVKVAEDDEEAGAAHDLREKRKSEHSGFDPSKKQAYNAPWMPDPDKRGVSPARERPPGDKA